MVSVLTFRKVYECESHLVYKLSWQSLTNPKKLPLMKDVMGVVPRYLLGIDGWILYTYPSHVIFPGF